MNACRIVSRGSGTSDELMYCTPLVTRVGIYTVTAAGRLHVYHDASAHEKHHDSIKETGFQLEGDILRIIGTT